MSVRRPILAYKPQDIFLPDLHQTHIFGSQKYTTKIILKTNFILQTFSSSIQITNIVLAED